ncbi:DUF1311 domain-containing protein [Curvibacter sp. CHRR-16]|uniref:lysozyme inhibitor LprI family protein n=1 Tax=Curvibacter sp. CHRR-16 TaxID=2835872 RepID=UPI001BDAB414|nr:lysozyme inhibitor LprI family protein [Curvibacter sp. CHRR-16]MBT0568882.1 DUF1311 domain-containing protein [Curvibacter sp. CHRR-16]
MTDTTQEERMDMKREIRHWIGAIAVGMLITSTGAQAASFDCAKAQSKVEKMICADAELSKLDEEMSASYQVALQNQADAAAIKLAQKQWLKKRAACTSNACIKDEYVNRLAALSNHLASRYVLTEESPDAAVPTTEVCQDFLENLKRLGNPPMVCDREFHPSMVQFTWPKWRPINALKHRYLVEQIWQNEYGWAHDEHLRASFESRARSGEIALAVTQIPIDGKTTTVIRFINGDKESPCEPKYWNSTYPLRQYFAIDSKLQKLDFGVTYKSVLNGYSSYSKEMRPDLFLHKGNPYIAFWDMKGDGKGTIEIFGDHRNFCHINFTNNTEGK